MRRVLVTGFEPFGALLHNPSSALLDHLPERLDGVAIAKAVLPVETDGVQPVLARLHQADYAAIVHLGLAEERAALSVERRAVNRRDFAIRDNSGALIRGRPVIDGGPDELPTRLPTDAILAAWAAADIEAAPSDSAGTFLCNQVMYMSLHRLPGEVPTGFIHLPPDELLAAAGRPHLTLSVQARAVLLALEVIAGVL